MSVTLTISETIAGAEVSDTLEGGDTGLDYGQVVSGSYAPLVDQVGNDGALDIFIRHDAVDDPITDVKLYVQTYTGTYGGANSSAADFTTLSNYGSSDTGATANNSDGNSRGLHIDMSWNVATLSQFDYSRETSGQKRIFGKTYTTKTGLSLANAFALHVDAMSYWNGSVEADATTPETGKIGISSDSVLGNRGHYKARWYLNSGALEGGILQYDQVYAYSYTS